MTHFLRALRFIGLTIIVFLSLTTAFIYFYNGQIKNILLSELDKNIKKDVTVKIDNVHLSWWSHFPNISLELKNVTVSQKIRKDTDTLINMQHIGLGLDISELLANDFTIEKIYLKKGKISMRVFDGKFNNYSIFNKTQPDSTSTKITLDLEKINIKKVSFNYQDLLDKHHYAIYFDDNYLKLKYSNTGIDTYLKGDLKVKKLQIKGKNYFENRAITTDIKLVYTKVNQQFILEESNLIINGGQFDLNGYYINNDVQSLDLTVKAHEAKLTALASLLPSSVSSIINKYKTRGNIYFDGKIKGNLSNGKTPAININFGFKNASFIDPTSKQAITEANLTGQFTNGSLRNTNTSELLIDDFSIKMQGGTAKGKFRYSNFSTPQVDMELEANMPFESLANFIGNNHFSNPKGHLSASIKLKAPLDLILNDQKNPSITSKGELKIKNVAFDINNSDLKCHSINGHFLINKTDLGIINFEGKAGNSDFNLNGIISQFIPFIFGYGDELLLQGGFNSKLIDLDQLLSQNINPDKNKHQNYNFKISPWLSFDLDCSFDKVKFRRLNGKDELRNVSGELHLKNQLFTYKKVYFTVASGKFENNGYINAKDENNIKLYNQCDLNKLDVQQFFYLFENFNQDFITDKNIKGKIKGKYNATLLFDQALRLNVDKLKFNTDFTITYGELINFTPLLEMEKYLTKKKYRKYVLNTDLNKIVFSELKTKISMIDGLILIPEMKIKNSLTNINISGTHSMDNKINYKIDFPLINYNKTQNQSNIDEKKYLNIFMEISGTTDDYRVDVKESQMLKDFTEVIKQNLKQDKPKEDETIELDFEDENNAIDID